MKLAEAMTDQNANDQALFMALVFSLHAAGMQQLGKMINPLSGEVERNLEQAQGTINMMEMLERRTAGNLSDEEKKLLERLLYELRMNYVDEAKAPAEKPGTEKLDKGTTDEAKEQADGE